ncbi:unnamed protein product, partial [Discosporangium mesarthrocarpum]
LEIKNKGLYLRTVGSSATSIPQHREDGAASSIPIRRAQNRLGPGFCILRERPVLARAVPFPDVALASLRKCTTDSEVGAGNSVSLQGYTGDFVGGMHRHFQLVGELLRHLYATIDRPERDTAANDKLRRLEARMGIKYKELQSLRASLPRSATGNKLAAVIKPLMDSLDHAFQALEHRR